MDSWDKTVFLLLQTIHWMAEEVVPLSKFELLHGFLTEIEVPDLLPQQQKGVAYSSQYTAKELLSVQYGKYCAHSSKNKRKWTVPIDEFTNIANHKYLVVYVQINDTDSFQPSTHFVANKEYVDTTCTRIEKYIQ